MPICHGGAQIGLCPVQAYETWVIPWGPFHCTGTESGYHAQHACLRIQIFHPLIWIVRTAHSGCSRKIETAVRLPCHLLDQQRHLFIHIQQMTFPAVFNGLFIHYAGIDTADGVLQFLQPFLLCSLVHTEDGFVFAGKGIAISVFHDTAGTYNNRGGSIMVQHVCQFFMYIIRDPAVP